MKAFLKIALLGSLLAPVSAIAAEEVATTRDGVAYTYTVELRDGVKHIVGSSSDGRAYRLRVVNGSVRGTFNGHPVAFHIAEKDSAKIASR